MAEGHACNQQLQEHMAQQLAHTLSTTVSNRLDKVLREEMKKSVPQSKNRLLAIEMQTPTPLSSRDVRFRRCRLCLLVMVVSFGNTTSGITLYKG